MCVAEFRDYCKSSSFKQKELISKNDHVHIERGSFYRYGVVDFYVTDKKKIKQLAKCGNQYAINDLCNEPERPESEVLKEK